MSRTFLLAAFLLASACGGSGGIGAVSCSVPGLRFSSSKPEILFFESEKGSEGRIVVAGLPADVVAAVRERTLTPEEWTAILRVTVVQREAVSQEFPAVAGTYAATGGEITFTPLFGFDAGRRYRVAFDPASLPDGVGRSMASIATEIGSPRISLPPTTIVDRVYPSVEPVPENLLRLYIHFSAPMGLKGGLDYIRLLDDQGVEVKDPFLPLDTEFWNGDRTRFTVFFDPGRVKRGILPNKEMGRSLTEGKPYTLVVSREWLDGQGLPLKEEFRRVFRVVAPDEQPLDQKEWRVEPPHAGTRDPLTVNFPEPLDHGLLLRALGVVTIAGGAVEGETRIDAKETGWTFRPREPWAAGDYRLRVLTILEDLAGNRIGRAFEVDQFERADRSPEPEEAAIPFRVTR